jgi:hypothetical protein
MEARLFLCEGERESEYNLLLAELAMEFAPLDTTMSILVERLVQQIWLLRRFIRWEAIHFNDGSGRPAHYRYLQEGLVFRERSEKASLQTIKELQRMKKARANQPSPGVSRPRKAPEAILVEFRGTIDQPEQ